MHHFLFALLVFRPSTPETRRGVQGYLGSLTRFVARLAVRTGARAPSFGTTKGSSSGDILSSNFSTARSIPVGGGEDREATEGGTAVVYVQGRERLAERDAQDARVAPVVGADDLCIDPREALLSGSNIPADLVQTAGELASALDTLGWNGDTSSLQSSDPWGLCRSQGASGRCLRGVQHRTCAFTLQDAELVQEGRLKGVFCDVDAVG